MVLTAETAIKYIKDRTDIFSKSEILEAKIFDGGRQSVDGLCNHLVLLKSKTTGNSVVLKQVMPYVKALKDDGIFIPLSLERINTEVSYLELIDKIFPKTVPKVYLWDKENSILVMEDLSHMKILRNEMINLKKFPEFPNQLGELLARSAFYTSEYFLSKNEKKALECYFEHSNNGSLFENLTFTGPFMNYNERGIYHKLQKDIDDLCNHSEVLKEVAVLRAIFLDKKQALIHSDLHTSNIFVDEKSIKVFDGEYAHYGPIAYDVGRIIGSIILNYASLVGMKGISQEKKQDYQTYILKMIIELYNTFETSYISLCQMHCKSDKGSIDMDAILKETIGFAACSCISRVYDYGLSFDFKRIDNLEERTTGRRFVIKLSKVLLLNRLSFNTIEEVVDAIETLTLKTIVTDLIAEAFENHHLL